jgi:hypothetical protein
MGYFTGQLKLNFLDGGLDERPFELAESFGYWHYNSGRIVTVPAGYRTDFASIPRFLWRILSPIGKHGKAAVIHDYLCDTKTVSFIEAATIFRDAMRDLGVGKIKRNAMYLAVRLFGPKF